MSDAAAAPHPIAITGMHRSGTSMITRGLHESGLHLIGGDADALLAAADDNPEGFWENKAIVTCNDDLLEAAGGSWDNPPKLLPVAVDDPRLAAVVEPATAALAGLAENEHWGFKDPRLCLTAAFWLDLQPDLRFVICVRNPLEVALSLKRRNQNSYSLGLSLWERYYESILELVPENRRIVTHYDTYFLDPQGELGRVCDFAGLEPASLTVRDDLRHHDVGVSLDEANLGSGVRDLYARLCEEAGAPTPPPSATDEGQVRRLVLDGTVAARHAEQRQQAIERLEERLAESQASAREAREELAAVRRESEARRAELVAVTRELDHVRADQSSRFDAVDAQQVEIRRENAEIRAQNQRLVDRADTTAEVVHRLDDRQRAMLDRTEHIGAILDAVHVKLRSVETMVQAGHRRSVVARLRGIVGRGLRRLRGRGVPAATKTAKATATRLPEPVQHSIRRVRRAVADGQAGNRIRERADRVTRRLPDPAQKAARKSTAVVRRSGAVPKASRVTRGVARRLPAPVKRAVKSVVAPTAPGRGAPARPKSAAPAPRPRQTDDGRSAAVPKGPASFKWQKGYERLVDEFISADTSWAVATPGCKPGVAAVAGRSGLPFPAGDGRAPAADSLSLIAVLEALRLRGVERLVLPEGARAWYLAHPELRDHLTRSHRLVVDREAAGAVFDLTAAAPDRHGVLTALKDLCVGRHSLPAVLDWTDLSIADDLPGFTTFSPAGDGGSTLPYFDDSVEVVVTTADRDLDEATRVAATAVVVAQRVGAELLVDAIHPVGDGSAPGNGVVIIAAATSAAVDEVVQRRTDRFGAELRFDVDPREVDAEIVVVVEPGTVPLPGAIDALVTATRHRPDSVTVAKVIDDHGQVEAAGGIVFADGSVAGIAAGTVDVRAPWHEFDRPTCWGSGLFGATAATWRDLPGLDAADPVAWCGAVWASGRTVDYCPAAAVVRVAAGPVLGPAGDAWAPVLATRPHRPTEFSDGAWRHLLANDDVRSLGPKGRA